MPDAPFFSIITATYNGAAHVGALAGSLAAQTCRDFNWIVQDGASSDATLDIVRHWTARLPETLCVSGPDSGIYDAWNRALGAHPGRLGRWALFLGADDRLVASDTLERAAAALSAPGPEVCFGAGDLILRDDAAQTRETRAAGTAEAAFRALAVKMSVGFTALFCRRDILTAHGFDPAFRIAGDYDFLVRAWHTARQLVPLGFPVAEMRLGGISNNRAMLRTTGAEFFRVAWRRRSLGGMLNSLDVASLHEREAIKAFLCKSRAGRRAFAALKRLYGAIVPR